MSYSQSNIEQRQYKAMNNEQQECAIVSLSNARSKPRTMMVKSQKTAVADRTMRCTWRSYNVACETISEIIESSHIENCTIVLIERIRDVLTINNKMERMLRSFCWISWIYAWKV